ncbi:GntR family transcriptional regulator [Methylobacterium indicum]|uniref:histidine utilization repressor n=1 Tax=Methylobacterium indicum TaxID=1775910 RepID=UPI000733D0F7|nr:histidine utilization repressor [Methylobacterium indicum]KTS42532.1 GntR family transcriptional regulator [Methylobacterium indicum]KTS54285.1 GntR family transcriptional regulator [Methylobacterium indicum]
MTAHDPARPEARPISLHQQILSEIQGHILSGRWPPGHRIPFEHELTAQFGCSRMTVNKVLTQLAAAGLIERRRKVGSFVRQPHSQSAVLEIPEIRTEVEALGLPYRFALLARRRRRSTQADRAALGLDAPAPVLALTVRHDAGPRPFCLEERLVHLAAVPEAEAQDFADEPPGTWLVRHVPWTAAEHRIRARAADADLAAAMACAPGAACLVVERRTWSAGRPVTVVRLTYPGEAHELVARFAPSHGPGAGVGREA